MSGPRLRLEVGVQSDVGLLRERNEDAHGEGIASDGSARVFVVADGMGGHVGGSIASRLAVDTALAAFGALGELHAEALRDVMAEANRVVYGRAREDASLRGMGTTAVMLALSDDGGFVANVGDSRVYRLRGGAFSQLTDDHSLVAEMQRRGILTAAQARVHPRRNELMQSLGAEAEVRIDVEALELRSGDVYLLCTDGLCGVVGDGAMALLLDRPPAEAAHALVEAALGEGGPDNVTVQVVRVEAV